MESRSSRWKNQGLIFIGLIISLMLCTRPGETFLNEFVVKAATQDNWVPLVSLLIIFFGSDAIGYIINSIAVTFICAFRGVPPGRWYTAEWEKNLKTQFWIPLREATPDEVFLKYDTEGRCNWLRKLAKALRNATRKTAAHQDSLNPKERMKLYPCDVILSYFWQQAPNPIVKWVSRRHDVYWTGMSYIYAFVLGVAVFLGFYHWLFDLPFCDFLWKRMAIAVVVIVVSAVFFYMHGYFARKEAWQIIELWSFHRFHYLFKHKDKWSKIKIINVLNLADNKEKVPSEKDFLDNWIIKNENT